MKKGWIQVNKDGAFEDIAPNTMANQVYMDDAMTRTVKEAITGLENKGSGSGGSATTDDVLQALQALQAFIQRPEGFATAAQGSRADAALPALQYTAQDMLNKLVSLGGANVCEKIGALPIRFNVGNNNCDSTVKSGLYTHVNWQNGPTGTLDRQGTLFVVEYNGGNPGWVQQFFMNPHVGTIWQRYVTNGPWAKWTILFNG